MTAASSVRQGIVLADAWREFAPPNQQRALRELEARTNLVSVLSAVNGGSLSQNGDQLQALSQQMGQVSRLVLGMQKMLLKRLRSGELVASGFVMPRRPDDPPVSIPIDVWAGTVNWSASEVKGGGLHFVSVGILPDAPESDATPALTPFCKPNGPGRPGVALEIKEAFCALVKGGSIDFTQPKVRSFDFIRNWLADRYPQRKDCMLTLSDKTLQRHTKAMFEKIRSDKIKE